MLEQEIKIVIDHDSCKGISCLNCVESCPREVLDWDKETKQVVVANFVECLVCLACEEACREDGNECYHFEGDIRKEFKPTPRMDMWGGAKEVKPPIEL
jgi:NAD-dependent dihydropyrimidine dehydrogenase PreA subunit